MKPPERKHTDFEKVKIGEFLSGVIEKVEYDMEHKFTYKGEDNIAPAIRFIFKLDGYQYPHYSRWMNFNVGEKANLYKKYIAKLVNNAKPDMDIDCDLFVGMRIKTIWEENGDFQNLESIYPAGQKLVVNDIAKDPPQPPPDDEFIPEIDDEDIPI